MIRDSKRQNEIDHTAIKLRAYPTNNQRLILSQWCGSMRFIYNKFLEIKKQRYEKWVEQGKPKNFDWNIDFQEELLWLKLEHLWLDGVPHNSTQQVFRHLNTAYQRWLSGKAKHPSFKKRSYGGQIHFTNSQVSEGNLRVEGRWAYVSLQNIRNQELKVRLHKPLPKDGRLLKTVVSKTPSNQYFVTLCYEIPLGSNLRESKRTPIARCGIDVGIANPLTISWKDSEGAWVTKVVGHEVQERLKKAERRLKKYQRRYARKYEAKKARQKKIKPDKETGEIQMVTTKNLEKARVKVAECHRDLANIRKDFAEKLSNQLASRFKVIKFEDLKLANMTRQVKKNEDGSDRKGVAAKTELNRGLLRLGLGNIVSLTAYKARLYGHEVHLVDPQKTSQRCFSCGHIAKENRLSQAEFSCVSCGHTDNADSNAAKNICTRRIDKKLRKVA